MVTSARLSSKAQIVIPAEIRRRLGIEPGDLLSVALEADRIVITRADPSRALKRLRDLGIGSPEVVEREIEAGRAGWDAQAGSGSDR
jgi:antitoxin PrlF